MAASWITVVLIKFSKCCKIYQILISSKIFLLPNYRRDSAYDHSAYDSKSLQKDFWSCSGIAQYRGQYRWSAHAVLNRANLQKMLIEGRDSTVFAESWKDGKWMSPRSGKLNMEPEVAPSNLMKDHERSKWITPKILRPRNSRRRKLNVNREEALSEKLDTNKL
jgi:hypothetical protein